MINFKLEYIRHKRAIFNLKRLALIITLLLCLFMMPFHDSGISQLWACPHYDDNGEEYYWYFDVDNSSTMLYMKDGYDRFIYLDPDYNVLYEEYKIYLFYDNERFPVKNRYFLKMESPQYAFEAPIKHISAENGSALTNNLFSLEYSLDVTDLNTVGNQSTLNRVNEVIKGNQLRQIGSKILKIEHKIKKEYTDTTPISEVKLKRISSPFKMHFKLDEMNLHKEDIGKLMGVYLEKDDNNQYYLAQIKGTYDASNHTFSFFSDKTGLHAVAVIDESVTSVSDAQNNISDEKETEELEVALDTSEEVEENDSEDKELLEVTEENSEDKEENIAYLIEESEEVSIDQRLSINSEDQQDAPLEKKNNRIGLIILGALVAINSVVFLILKKNKH